LRPEELLFSLRALNDGLVTFVTRLASARFRIGRIVLGVQTWLAVLAGLGLASLVVAQVLLRYVFELPILGIEEISVLLGEWVYFLGAAHATWRNEHIRGGLASLFLKGERARLVLRAFGDVVCLMINCGLAYYAAAYWVDIVNSGRTSVYLSWPSALWVTSMALGLILMSIYLLLRALEGVLASVGLGRQTVFNTGLDPTHNVDTPLTLAGRKRSLGGDRSGSP
jgi:TRAP-type C4-dicarboxylate transport system permease small subunit